MISTFHFSFLYSTAVGSGELCISDSHHHVLPHLCEDVVRLAENPSGIGVRSHEEFQRADVDISAQCPEVRLLQVIHTLQLLHLQREPQEPTAND